MSKALVIGANGFLGSHLVDQLSSQGFDVTAFDRFGSRKPVYIAGGVREIRGDFLSAADLDIATRGQDVVFHFLSLTTPHSAEADPAFDVRANVSQSVELLEACVRNGVQRFFFASTGGAIYGPQQHRTFAESDVTKPVSPYAIGKLAIENYLRYFETAHGLHSTALRISNPYGARQRASKGQGLIPIALRAAESGAPVIQFGDGSMVRDYIYVQDLMLMIGKLASSKPLHNVYNLGSGVGTSVRDVFDVVGEVTGKSLNIEIRDKPVTFVDAVTLNISQFEDEFGVINFTPLKAGIAQTFASLES